jgi:hypothetical protein
LEVELVSEFFGDHYGGDYEDSKPANKHYDDISQMYRGHLVAHVQNLKPEDAGEAGNMPTPEHRVVEGAHSQIHKEKCEEG